MPLADAVIRILDSCYILKWAVSYFYLRSYKSKKKNRLDFYDPTTRREPENVGFIAHPTEIELESPLPDSQLVKGHDKVFFYGVNSQSEFLIVSIARSCSQRAESNVYLKLSNGKTYHLEYDSDFQQSSSDANVFSCGGLQLYYLCPMRRWRIFFSGFLKETTEGEEDCRMAYVKFSLLWRASSNVYDSSSDMNDSSIRKSLSKEHWDSLVPPLNKFYSALDFYSQAGVILGNVCVDDSLEDYEIYLFGQRIRYLGDSTISKEMEFSHRLGYVHKNGAYFHLAEASVTGVAKRIKFGYIVKPTGEIKPIESVKRKKSKSPSEQNDLEMKATIQAGRSYACCGSTLSNPVFESSSKEKSIGIYQLKCDLDDRAGTGILIKGKSNLSTEKNVSDIAISTEILELDSLSPFVVAFTDDVCQVPEITGGKGSSLGKLTKLSQDLQTFMVPSGIVVTTHSYKEFITEEILIEIRQLENVLYGNVEGDVKEVSKKVCEKIIAEEIPNSISENIFKKIEKIFGEEYILKKYAVRSSATGEDTEQMSAAGQMDTYLGIRGIENILSAVKKCWASQFGYTAIQYKRRYGQSLNTPMAVVIQEMVECETAGVLFTCNPVTGNPTIISIAANYGLGESVVSASEEPDTIELTRSAEDSLSLRKMTIGSKSHRIVSGDFGTTLEDVSDDERQQCCISEENALKLGHLALAIEKYYRSRRDIEWGMLNSKIYIFQSRPVTSGTQETDFEIEHEFDGPLRVENEIFSVSNCGENLPGAMSPLGTEAFFKMISIVWNGSKEMQIQVLFESRYIPAGWMTMCKHAMFSVADLFGETLSKDGNNFEKLATVAYFGRILDDEEVLDISRERHIEKRKIPIKAVFRLAKCLLSSVKRLKKTQKHYANYRIPLEELKSSKELFEALMKRCCDLTECTLNHMICTLVSTLLNMTVFSVLSDAKGGIDNEVFTDYATLVTSKSAVESADVPSSIKALAYHISKSTEPHVFKEMKVEEALTWLSTTTTSAGEQFREFIKKHGHRCLMELDIFSVPWGDNPKPLVQLLQNMMGHVPEDDAHETGTSVGNLLSQLKIPIGFFSKLKLKYIVPLCQRAIQRRETSKSLQVKGLNEWRKGYRSLAKMMVAEGRIPEDDLLFFMTIDEIQEILNTRSPRILAKAYHRQRLHPKINKYTFPEMIKGLPKPQKDSLGEADSEEGYFSMNGVPVSRGVCKGYIRVALSLDDAADLKQGEILLAFSTDVGWTPYFPMVSGVATELGGLISHGAVVSREYGLPCIVGLHGATRRFKTGDYVLLDGNQGILQKIQDPTEEQ